MIVRAYAYDGSKTAARRLDSHLWKDAGQRPELLQCGNLVVHNTYEGMAVMAALKDGSKASTACWQIIVSPRKTLNRKECLHVVEMIVAELKAHDHPLMVFWHRDKPRSRMGGGANHLHIVLGHVSPISFRALDMSHHAPRLHKVMAVAEFHVEGVASRSPWHEAIVSALQREGNPRVADWLVDSQPSIQLTRPPRMTDSMRRSAQAVGFALPEFQADLERLWTGGASQSEIEAFLAKNHTVMKRGKSPNYVVLYHRMLFVGVLHHVLRKDAASVYEETNRRFPSIFEEKSVSDFRGQEQDTADDERREFGTPSSSRAVALERQRRVDKLEGQLADLRWERLRRIYQPELRDIVTAAPVDNAGNRDGAEWDSKMRDRTDVLRRAEAILETAVALLWHDDEWLIKSDLELLTCAEKLAISVDLGGSGRREKFGCSTENLQPEETHASTSRPFR